MVITGNELQNLIIDAAGSWSQYRSFTTPIVEACRFFSEKYPDGIPQDVVDFMMNRFVPWAKQ